MTERLERVLTELEAIFKFTEGFSYGLDEGELFINIHNELYLTYLEEMVKVLEFYSYEPYKLVNDKLGIVIICSDKLYKYGD